MGISLFKYGDVVSGRWYIDSDCNYRRGRVWSERRRGFKVELRILLFRIILRRKRCLRRLRSSSW